MKKFHALLGALLCLSSAQMSGRTITPDEAIARVAGNTTMSKAPTSYRLVHTDTGASGDATVYVFDDKAGRRLFLSADDRAEALLGYVEAEAANSDKMPPQLQWWLSEYSRQIEAIRSSRAQLQAIDAVESKRAEIAPMLTTVWAQTAPFNALCPTVDGKETLTGCGATAMAQVMNYFKWPEHGTGMATATSSDGTSYTMDLSTAHFDWANMADNYDGDINQAQKDAVALLMKACGYAAKTDYSPDWTNSTMVDIATALRDNFGYAPTVRAYQMIHYGLKRWEEMIYNNLATTGPVIYRGNSLVEGGHIFVCDGYGGDGFFHFNWGWRGYYDGYFRLSALNPYYSYTGIEHGGFSQGQWAVLGIQRPTDGLTSPEPEMYQARVISSTVSGSTMTLQAGWYNASSETLATAFGVCIERLGGNSGLAPIYLTCGSDMALAPDYGWNQISFSLPTQDMPDGDYTVTPVYRFIQQDATWRTPIHNPAFADYVLLKKSGTEYKAMSIEPYLMDITAIKVPSTIYNMRLTELRLKFENTSDEPAASYFDTRLIGDNTSVLSMSDGFLVALEPGESVTKTVFLSHGWNTASATASSYTLRLADITAGYYRGSFPVEIAEEMGAPELSCTSFTIAGGTENVDPDNVTFLADVSCLSGYCDMPLYLSIYSTVPGTGWLMRSNIGLVILEPGHSCTLELAGALPDSCRNLPELIAVLSKSGSGPESILAQVKFTLSTSGIDNIQASPSEEFTISFDPVTRCAEAVTPKGECSMTVFSIDGRQAIHADSTSVLDLSGLAGGIYIIVARDSDGGTASLKVAL